MVFHTDRREFLVLAAGGVLALSRLGGVPAPLRIGVLGPVPDSADPRANDAQDGLTLGIEESVRTAGMFGRKVEFISDAPGPGEPDAMVIASRLLDRGCAALITLVDGSASSDAARTAAARRRPCVHVLTAPGAGEAGADAAGRGELFIAPPADARAEALLRALHADSGLLRRTTPALLATSDALLRRAIAIDRRVADAASAAPLLTDLARVDREPPPQGDAGIVLAADDPAAAATTLASLGGRRYAGTLIDLFGVTESLPAHLVPPRVARADAWTPTLDRFGAAQLNDRFRARFGSGAGMRGPAWGGWFAAKILVETALRNRGADDDALGEALLRARFDGHKGTPLSFSPQGHLHQPLHVVGLTGRES